MSNLFSIGMSGMQAAQFRMDIAAHHIANASTPGFQRQQVVAQAQPSGGVRTESMPAAGSGENLAEDLVSQRQAMHLYSANLRTVQVADRMLGALLDTVA